MRRGLAYALAGRLARLGRRRQKLAVPSRSANIAADELVLALSVAAAGVALLRADVWNGPPRRPLPEAARSADDVGHNQSADSAGNQLAAAELSAQFSPPVGHRRQAAARP